MALRYFVPVHCCVKAIVISLAMTFMLGCAKEDSVVTYTVPKHELIQIPVETPDGPMSAPTGSGQQQRARAVPNRMLAALILDKEVAWSFKGLAPVEDFSEDASEKFDSLIKSMKFENPGEPTWELGESWKQLPGSGMRYANLKLENVVFSVIRLPLRDGDREKYTLDNINRWRGQLGLPKIAMDGLEENARKLVTADQHDATIIDIEGLPNQSVMPPMAGGVAAPPMVNRKPATTEKKPVPFTGKPPENWKPQELRMFQLASYVATVGDDAANISVSTAGGSLLGNVNRWRGQVGLDEVKAKSEIDAEEIRVGEKTGTLTEMHGPDGESIVVAIVPDGSQTWFFKLMGKTAAVEKEAQAFKEYLGTIKLN